MKLTDEMGHSVNADRIDRQSPFDKWLNDPHRVWPFPSLERLSLDRDAMDDFQPTGDGDEGSDNEQGT